MPPIPPLAAKLIGLLSLSVCLLVIGRELQLSEGLDWLLYAPTLLLALLFGLYVPFTRQVFVLAAFALSIGNLVYNPDWRSTLHSGFITASFIAAFFSALTTLKFAADTSPAIRKCGRFLSQQPPGRRYLALTFGGQLFGLLLNYGAISLLGSMSLSHAAEEANEEIRRHRVRRMLLAVQRGFISILPWSPFSFAIVISTSLVPGTSWLQCVLPGLVTGTVLASTGWLLDTLFKPKLSGSPPPKEKPDGDWFAVMPLIALLLLLVLLLTAARLLTGARIQALVMIVAPLVSLAWIAVQAGRDRPLRQVGDRAGDYLMIQLAGFRSEMVLLMMAGYIGIVASPLLGTLLQVMNVDLAALPGWAVLVLIVWLIPIAGQIGMNPILAAALIAPVLPDAAHLGVPPVSIVVAITAGWILSGVSSPFTATTLLVGRFGGVSAAHVGQRWNGLFTILCAALLSVWVVIYATPL